MTPRAFFNWNAGIGKMIRKQTNKRSKAKTSNRDRNWELKRTTIEAAKAAHDRQSDRLNRF
ncbi:hypothetical protein FFIC_231610 [Fructobacillus ficulneus]|uniref:Uncharacterized protein n=1 Tax=Fructobacillus ficulneus TaxID=157463 RepID=A0A0K8MIG9_9LACO|nr:hypothetical protein FFIC_231610 [Fructobacillus ficulneus]